ncbi:MAG: hypothetical protein QXK88_03285 [Desulfurococcaceae archaeon]
MRVDVICKEKKRAGGKLIKICLKLKNCYVDGVILTGDFFVEPIEEFEEALKTLARSKVPIDELVKYVMVFIQEIGLELCGLTSNDIEEVLENAINEVRKLCSKQQ